MPDIIGVLVFMDKHVGVYIGNGEVVEARNFDCGVQKTKLKDRKWTRWGYCPFIEYIAEEKKPKSVSKKQEKRAVTITNPVHKFLIL